MPVTAAISSEIFHLGNNHEAARTMHDHSFYRQQCNQADKKSVSAGEALHKWSQYAVFIDRGVRAKGRHYGVASSPGLLFTNSTYPMATES